MKVEHLPKIDTKYWCALIVASIFGANTGDFLADDMGLGHISGLPILLAVFAAIFIAEKFDKFKHHAYFWAAIIVTRAAATNIGDIGHDFHVSGLIVIGILAIALIITVFLWKKKFNDVTNLFAMNPLYWWTMLVAGALGTAVGDYFSFGLGLGNLNATFVLGTLVAGLFYFGRNGNGLQLVYYWLVVVAIRSAGTAAGDFFAHKVFGLGLSTAIWGALFIVALYLLRERSDNTVTV